MNQAVENDKKSRWLDIVKRVGRWTWVIVSWIVAAMTILAAQGGRFNPDWSTLPALLAMTFPAWFLGNLIIGIINIFHNRIAAAGAGVALLLSLGAFWTFCPLNFFNGSLSAEERARSFSFMSFNAYLWEDSDSIYPAQGNRSASFIINSGVDIACLQEATPWEPRLHRSLTQAQLDSIDSIYPYSNYGNPVCHIISKYPLRNIPIRQHPSQYCGFSAAEIDIKGEKVVFISVHLESIGLPDEDKTNFIEMTEGSADVNWRSASGTYYRKLSHAFRVRAEQARMMRHTLDSLQSLGHKNIILSGDFNDIGDCYAMRVISGGSMKNAYSRAGLGPVVTYHANRFYFNIDHILYQGDLEIADISHGSETCSDHYPVFATFLLTDPAIKPNQ